MKEKILDKAIARGVLRAPSIRPGTELVTNKEILATVRPSWSKQEPYALALPGGKIEIADFQSIVEAGLITEEQLMDPDFVPTPDMLKIAGKMAVEREFMEELNLVGLHWVAATRFINDLGYQTFPYYADLEVKPTVVTKPESGGTVWLDEREIIGGNMKMLLGNLEVAQHAIILMEMAKKKKIS